MNKSPIQPIDIAYSIGMSHREFSKLSARGKWYYFYLVHYGPNCTQIQYLFRDI